MQLVLEKGGYKIIFTCKRNLSNTQLTGVVEQLSNTLNQLICDDAPVDAIQENVVPRQAAPAQAITMTKERPAFRDRLPNNVVDVKDLTVKQAVTENALVRCPECGQAHAIIVKSGVTMYLMRKDYDKNEFIVIAELPADDAKALMGVCWTETTSRLDYFNDLQVFKEKSSDDFAVNNETEIFCPVCQKSNAFIDWKQAFDAPLTYFETEHLCDACGGEVVEKVVKGNAYSHCENCGLERPSKEQA